MDVCIFCGKEYRKRSANQKYCCSICESRCKYRRHRIKHIEIVSRWKRNNAEKAREYCRIWKKRNKKRVLELAEMRRTSGKVRVDTQNCRARKIGKIGRINISLWERLSEKYNGKCPICKKHIGRELLTIDHIIPISRGGQNTEDNIQLLCRSCNTKKGVRL